MLIVTDLLQLNIGQNHNVWDYGNMFKYIMAYPHDALLGI